MAPGGLTGPETRVQRSQLNVAFIQRPAVINPEKPLILDPEEFFSLWDEENSDDKCSFSTRTWLPTSWRGGERSSLVVILIFTLLC